MLQQKECDFDILQVLRDIIRNPRQMLCGVWYSPTCPAVIQSIRTKLRKFQIKILWTKQRKKKQPKNQHETKANRKNVCFKKNFFHLTSCIMDKIHIPLMSICNLSLRAWVQGFCQRVLISHLCASCYIHSLCNIFLRNLTCVLIFISFEEAESKSIMYFFFYPQLQTWRHTCIISSFWSIGMWTLGTLTQHLLVGGGQNGQLVSATFLKLVLSDLKFPSVCNVNAEAKKGIRKLKC